ncbi:hypothetical protein Trco_002056 [Trichoderma cornu-damae]|uniref:HCNGP-domain-containing protein n=1 Tax=Trichoderma cornu-damae TaxID=654480 RepID=A0A9P8QNM5_9HYPO|nr:hypothetical protein Trco_002056 [Trichoderma cornu-damae]
MAGLVGYASSDDEGEDEQPQLRQEPPQVATQAAALHADEIERGESRTKTSEESSTAAKQDSGSPPQPPAIGPVIQNAVPLGPSLPPVGASMVNTLLDPDDGPQEPPASPYSSNRALIHDLTLPSVPNLDIPPSPPGSPPPGANQKVEQFLQLKQKGVHFNSKLEQSTALRNPSLMDKLLEFVGIDEVGQYETTLPKELWDPRGFPEWAFRDRLSRSREKIAKEKEAERTAGGRTAIDFVASASSSSSGGATGLPGGLSSGGEKRKGGWR